MKNKEKNRLREKMSRLKQAVMIILMIISGIWYVTKGRAGNGAEVKFYSASGDPSDMGITESKNNKYDEDDKGYNEYNGLNYVPQENVYPSKGDKYISETEREKEYENDNRNNKENDRSDSEPDAVGETSSIAMESESDKKQSSSAASLNLVNLNTATLQELDSLPGVGPATAKNILEYREKYGGFASIEEIKNVKRIGDKTFEKLKDYITV